MARGVLTAEKVASVVAAARALETAHLARHEGEKFATINERVSFDALLFAIGQAVENGHEPAK